jgi:asparagine synthase (glutamine-hydrolysing)
MCSILALLDLQAPADELRPRALELSRVQRHRGPDWSGIWSDAHAILAHERLAIVGVEDGAQPLHGGDGRYVLAVNGEIYNHTELAADLDRPYAFATGSDCEVLIPLFMQRGADFLPDLNGIFAFVLYDRSEDRWIVARDHMGIIPLYMGRDAAGTRYVASELKALTPVCVEVEEFPPGHVLDSRTGELVRWYDRPWMHAVPAPATAEHPRADAAVRVREALEAAVHRQLMSDVPYGALLSGGLDSSIIAAVAARYSHRRIEDGDESEAWWRACTPSPSVWRARPTSRGHRRSQTTSAPFTTASSTPSRRVSTHCRMRSGTSRRTT